MGCVAFHIGFLKKESACCESLSHASGVPAPFGKGALRAVPAANFARESSANRYCPSSARYRYCGAVGAKTKAPLAKGGWFGEAKPGGFRGWQVSTWVCTLKKCLLWNPSVTPPACQLPLTREPRRAAAANFAR